PESNAVIVRRHGIYVWGATWQQAKSQAECIDYLCETAVEMKKLGVPISGGSTESESVIASLRKSFLKIDRNGDEKLTIEELRESIKAIGS
ncbi:unnamed protein product, partial [Oikopleura dioica]